MGRINLVLDIDGCVLNYDWLLEKILKENNIKVIIDKSIWARFNLPRKVATKYIIKSWEDDRFSRLPTIPGFPQFYKEVVASNKYNITYCSTVSINKGKENRIKNLLDLKIYNPIFFAASAKEKGEYVKKLNGKTIFIDDKPENINTVKGVSPETSCYWFNYLQEMHTPLIIKNSPKLTHWPLEKFNFFLV